MLGTLMRRHIAVAILLLAIIVLPTESLAQALQIEGQNRIRLFGSWRITVEAQSDDFDLLVRTAAGESFMSFDEDDFDDGLILPFTIGDDAPSGWTIDVFDDNDEDGAPPGFIEAMMIDEKT